MDIQIRIKILNNIFGHLQMVTQWAPSNFENCSEYTFKAEALIELLEEEDCGSHGGFDKSNPNKHETGFDIFDRFLTLVRKYNNENNLIPRCNFTLDKMTKYYKVMSELRSEMINQ